MIVRFRALCAPFLLALIVAGCGSSSGSKSTPGSGAAAPGPYGGVAATSSTASAQSAAPVVITTKRAKKLGTILAAGPKRLTVYAWDADAAGRSGCAGACARVWPPVTGRPTASGGAIAADLGTITRPDGATQVTYKGHPLYYFAKDRDDGDTYGQGSRSFGAGWYVLMPNGRKIDTA